MGRKRKYHTEKERKEAEALRKRNARLNQTREQKDADNERRSKKREAAKEEKAAKKLAQTNEDWICYLVNNLALEVVVKSEQNSKRLAKQRIRQQKLRDSETPKERQTRNEKMAEYLREMRRLETNDEWNARINESRDRMWKMLQSERKVVENYNRRKTKDNPQPAWLDEDEERICNKWDDRQEANYQQMKKVRAAMQKDEYKSQNAIHTEIRKKRRANETKTEKKTRLDARKLCYHRNNGHYSQYNNGWKHSGKNHTKQRLQIIDKFMAEIEESMAHFNVTKFREKLENHTWKLNSQEVALLLDDLLKSVLKTCSELNSERFRLKEEMMNHWNKVMSEPGCHSKGYRQSNCCQYLQNELFKILQNLVDQIVMKMQHLNQEINDALNKPLNMLEKYVFDQRKKDYRSLKSVITKFKNSVRTLEQDFANAALQKRLEIWKKEITNATRTDDKRYHHYKLDAIKLALKNEIIVPLIKEEIISKLAKLESDYKDTKNQLDSQQKTVEAYVEHGTGLWYWSTSVDWKHERDFDYHFCYEMLFGFQDHMIEIHDKIITSQYEELQEMFQIITENSSCNKECQRYTNFYEHHEKCPAWKPKESKSLFEDEDGNEKILEDDDRNEEIYSDPQKSKTLDEHEDNQNISEKFKIDWHTGATLKQMMIATVKKRNWKSEIEKIPNQSQVSPNPPEEPPSSPNPDDIMKENPNYIRKRKPIDFTLNDLVEEDDDSFSIDVQPSTSRSLPTRNCKPKNFREKNQNHTEEDESEVNDSEESYLDKSSDSEDDLYDYPEDYSKFDEKMTENSNEPAKNSSHEEQSTSNDILETIENPICILVDQRNNEKKAVGRTELMKLMQEKDFQWNYIRLPLQSDYEYYD